MIHSISSTVSNSKPTYNKHYIVQEFLSVILMSKVFDDVNNINNVQPQEIMYLKSIKGFHILYVNLSSELGFSMMHHMIR